ncbi:valacyclovir hydrolase-like isoform X2 [Physella acuta]|uniref:valacyclovir hydrolase-like isoform X2 n=1 Tax=Physella acuta TaxID=109671 RepID=UPI0027DCD7B9|nr:valacyclovir hydrolase-like isoform X2 [Physella acuta]
MDSHIDLDLNLVLANYKYNFCSCQISSTSLPQRDVSVLTSHKKNVDGIDFHYEVIGKGEHHVLLIPGALGFSRIFLPQLTGLSSEKYTLIAFDPRGFGKSRPPDRDWPLMYMQRDAEDAAQFMKSLGIPRYSVLGWSDGGTVGLILAANYTGSVQKLLVWGANAYVNEQDLEFCNSVKEVKDWSPKMRDAYTEVYGEEYLTKQSKAWVHATHNYFTQRNGDICIGSLPNIKCPTLIVNGQKDSIISQEHAAFLVKHIPNCKLIEWPDGKHNLHLQHPKQFNVLAEEFLDEGNTIKV